MARLENPSRIRRFIRDESGAAMVEFAMVVVVFFLMIASIIDFGIFASNNLMAEKSVQIAARVATVRPPACAEFIPERYSVGTAIPAPRFGTSCGAVPNACAMPAEVTCVGSASNATASEIWARISPQLPAGTDIDDLTFTYTPDPKLGYLGGPYVPEVTVELTVPEDYSFPFAIDSLVNLASGATETLPDHMDYKNFSITLPGEDLANGTDG
ncbi:TadE-like protein [Jannaschia faecimaris]|uniref:TadE-like protein n=1 Tax=Jannaschia faecimaris TaxID=1244108 RepID=A0A1H3TKV4_9RHOB|nr:TadE/TadG family type IV pilus assembly protein [Jannaschia faecimaris]SDZ50894.1 TadE-like protein [Jannaschia faecimaris]